MQKNVAGQKWYVFAFGGNLHTTPGDAITGDAASITAQLSKDGAPAAALGQANPVEIGGGFYVFDLTQAETDAEALLLMPASATPNVLVQGTPGSYNTVPPGLSDLSIINGGVTLEGKTHTGAVIPTVSTLTNHTPQSGDSFPVVGNIQSRLPVALDDGRMVADTKALNGDASAAANLANGALQLEPFIVGTSPSASSIPTNITGAPFTTTDHYKDRVVTINKETKAILGSAGSPVVLTVADFVSVPSQNDIGVIS